MPRRIERVVLLGFMCSGKSTIAERLARRLEWRLFDFDDEVERRDGRAVAEIIATDGEEYFRGLERALTKEVSAAEDAVIAPGGGWIMNPALLDSLAGGTFSVWLDVSAREIVDRMMDDPRPRPLRDHPSPLDAVTEMLSEREPLFRRADLRIPGDGASAEGIAYEIEQLVRGRR